MKLASAYTFRQRLLGFHGVSANTDAIHIAPCNMIQTFLMQQPITLVWLDSEFHVIKVESSVPPNTIRRCSTATSVIELRTASSTELKL